MPIARHRPSTAGERLFLYIEKELVGPNSPSDLYETQILKIGGRTYEFSQYFHGYACSNILVRLLKKATRVIELERSDPTRVVTQYIERLLEVGSKEKRNRLAAVALDACKASGKTIPPSVEQAVLGRHRIHKCYFCGCQVQKRNSEEWNRLELDHIWPSSYGGDSVEENLLPSCGACNRQKGDMILWYTAHISGFCLKPTPSTDEQTVVDRRVKIAWYMRRIFDLATSEQITLKDAALKLGPMEMSNQQSIDNEDARDFFNLSFSGD